MLFELPPEKELPEIRRWRVAVHKVRWDPEATKSSYPSAETVAGRVLREDVAGAVVRYFGSGLQAFGRDRGERVVIFFWVSEEGTAWVTRLRGVGAHERSFLARYL